MNLLRQKTIVFLTTFLTIIAFSPWKFALAQGGRYNDWHMGPGMMGNWGMGGFGGLFMIIFWVLVVAGLVFLIKRLFQSTRDGQSAGGSGYRAIEILKERYARGEISKSEFEAMKNDLA
jgi:putative membrane protein